VLGDYVSCSVGSLHGRGTARGSSAGQARAGGSWRSSGILMRLSQPPSKWNLGGEILASEGAMEDQAMAVTAPARIADRLSGQLQGWREVAATRSSARVVRSGCEVNRGGKPDRSVVGSRLSLLRVVTRNLAGKIIEEFLSPRATRSSAGLLAWLPKNLDARIADAPDHAADERRPIALRRTRRVADRRPGRRAPGLGRHAGPAHARD